MSLWLISFLHNYIDLIRELISLSRTEAEDKDFIDDLILVEVNNIRGINALANNQKIEFSPNLTVVFGENGSGKTGYIRLFNNAFSSRGEKDILPNIFDSSNKETPYCCFKFKSKENEYQLEYPADKYRQELRSFSVFDNTSVRIHLDKENELFFTPSGFDFFEKLIECYTKIQELLDEEITLNSPENQFKMHFTSQSEIKQLVDNLDASTDLSKLVELSNFTESDQNKIKELETQKGELLALRIDDNIKELNSIKNALLLFKEKLVKMEEKISESFINTVKLDLEDLIEKEETSKSSGVNQFKTELIKGTGSHEWKKFIEAAYQFAKIHYSDTLMYPEDSELCLFCLQTLNHGSKELIKRYWDYLNSTIEEEIRKATNKLMVYKTEIKKIDTNVLSDDSILVKWFNEKDISIFSRWKKDLEDAQKQLNIMLDNLENKKWLLIPTPKKFDLKELNAIEAELEFKIKELKEQNPAEEIKKIDLKIQVLKERNLLAGLIPAIKEFINKHVWAQKAVAIRKVLNTRNITAKQSELYNIFITENYKQIFNNECKRLNANFGIEVSQKGQRGRTVRQLKIIGFEPKRVLSEGEQRAISLADFLTEITISNFNKGIIFDDPVNSLDHERKKVIALRLAEECKNRQVFVFTHDLVFLYHLKNFVTDFELEFKCHWVQKRGNVPGNIFLNNSPDNEREYKSTVKAQEFYAKSKDAPPQEQEYFLKQGFGALRTNYEHFVIFDLFGEVVLRFNERVSIGRLKDLVFPEEVIHQVIQKSDELSRYIEPHLHSDEYAAVKPSPELLNKEIQEFINLKNRLKEEKKKKREGKVS